MGPIWCGKFLNASSTFRGDVKWLHFIVNNYYNPPKPLLFIY